MIHENQLLRHQLKTNPGTGHVVASPSVHDVKIDRTGNGHLGDYWEWRNEVADELRNAGFEMEAEKYESCSCDQPLKYITAKTQLKESSNGRAVVVCTRNPAHKPLAIFRTCQSRICPDCAKRASARFMARFMPRVRELIEDHHHKYRFRKIVLTTPFALEDDNARQKYIELKSKIPRVFDFLLSKGWRKDQGFIRAAEFGPNGHKLHFHLLFYGEWIENRKGHGTTLSEAWKTITGGDCEVTYIAGVKVEDVEHEAIESLKYAVKFWKEGEDGETVRLESALMPKLHQVLKGTRRIEGYGVFYKLPPAPERVRECPVCGSECSLWWIGEWNIYAQTGWRPDEQELYLRLAHNSDPPPDKKVLTDELVDQHGIKITPETPKPDQQPMPGFNPQQQITGYEEI